MGVWDVGPFDNDDAGDMIAGLAKHVRKICGGKGSSDDYYAARAAAQLILVAHGTDILGGPSPDRVIEALARMRSDAEWLACFKEPKRIARALEAELAGATAHVTACSGCRRAHGKNGLRALVAAVEAACAAPIPKSAFGARRKGLKPPPSRLSKRELTAAQRKRALYRHRHPRRKQS